MTLLKRLILSLAVAALCAKSARAQSDSLLTRVLLDSASLFGVNSEFAQVSQKPRWLSTLFVASGGLENRRGRSAFFVPIGAIGGSMAMLGRCWKSR